VAKAAHSSVPTIRGARNRGARPTARRATAAPTTLSPATNRFTTDRPDTSSAYRPTPKRSVSSNQMLIAANPAHHRATRTPIALTDGPGEGSSVVLPALVVSVISGGLAWAVLTGRGPP
jgi:hypothetical protein